MLLQRDRLIYYCYFSACYIEYKRSTYVCWIKRLVNRAIVLDDNDNDNDNNNDNDNDNVNDNEIYHFGINIQNKKIPEI